MLCCPRVRINTSFEDAASTNCDALVTRALSIAPNEAEVLMALASIRMSQSKFDEAKAVVQQLYTDMEGRDPCTSYEMYLANSSRPYAPSSACAVGILPPTSGTADAL